MDRPRPLLLARPRRKVTLIAMSAPAILFSCALFWPAGAGAIPAFARRYEMSCRTCHRGHFPRLNALGRRFRENGYQLADGAEDIIRARTTVEPGTTAERLSVFKEVPLSVRGQVLGVARLREEVKGAPKLDGRIFAFLLGGGSIYEDVAFFFSWTPFPESSVHQARVGFHNLFEDILGEGTLNLRAGALLLLDFAEPSHRFLSPGAAFADGVKVGLNRFALGDTTLGLAIHGRPLLGGFSYELALVAGDPGAGIERDDYKDGFARASYLFFQDTEHELTVGGFGYFGRSEIITTLGGIDLAIRDDFAIVGADLSLALGPFDLVAMALASRHMDPDPRGQPIAYAAGRAELSATIGRDWVVSARYEQVISKDDPSLAARVIQPHITYLVATNVLLTVLWRHDFRNPARSAGVAYADVVF